jgi:hypothetical protein
MVNVLAGASIFQSDGVLTRALGFELLLALLGGGALCVDLRQLGAEFDNDLDERIIAEKRRDTSKIKVFC